MMSDGKVIPPAAVAVLISAGADKIYDTHDDAQAHRRRTPSWGLPPNRAALSKQWAATAATAYL